MTQTQLTLALPIHSLAAGIVLCTDLPQAVDVVELRLDYLHPFSIKTVRQLISAMDRPYILTLRSPQEGGCYRGTEAARYQDLQSLMALSPPYLDIEATRLSAAQIDALHALSPRTELIGSYHHDGPPDHIDPLTHLDTLRARLSHPHIALYKLIVRADCTRDALNMMHWVYKRRNTDRITGHCLGKAGQISRIASPAVGNALLYTRLAAMTDFMPESVPLETLCNTYHITRHTRGTQQTQLYGVIGDPVHRSMGPVFHNRYFKDHNLPGLYLPIQITQEELGACYALLTQLPFTGLSVTMPLKEAISTLLPSPPDNPKQRVVNTLRYQDNQVQATQTDGLGAVSALLEKTALDNKKILIIGAGGAAQGMIPAMQAAGGLLTLTNRTEKKGIDCAVRYTVATLPFKARPPHPYPLIINTLPNSVYQDATLLSWIHTLLTDCELLMNINYGQQHDPLEKLATEAGCTYLNGERMYHHQALAQQAYWQGQHAVTSENFK